nr:hypothetical protein [uncultured Duganella sp.]
MPEPEQDRGAAGWGNLTVGDPLLELEAGANLNFEAVQCKFTEAQFAEIKLDWSKMNGVMLCVGFGNAEGTEIMGSAVMVAPGLAVCAWHVFLIGWIASH